MTDKVPLALSHMLRVLSLTKESSFNLRDAGSLVHVGMLFCNGLLTVGSRLCIFCSLHFRTLRDHCRAANLIFPTVGVVVLNVTKV